MSWNRPGLRPAQTFISLPQSSAGTSRPDLSFIRSHPSHPAWVKGQTQFCPQTLNTILVSVTMHFQVPWNSWSSSPGRSEYFFRGEKGRRLDFPVQSLSSCFQWVFKTDLFLFDSQALENFPSSCWSNFRNQTFMFKNPCNLWQGNELVPLIQAPASRGRGRQINLYVNQATQISSMNKWTHKT